MYRYRVDGVAETIPQVKLLTGVTTTGVGRCPWVNQPKISFARLNGFSHILNDVAWRKAIYFDGRSINEWLKRRSHLSVNIHVVKLKIFVINPANPNLHMPV